MSGLIEKAFRSSTSAVFAGRDLFYPPACSSCGRSLPAAESRLCGTCRELLIPSITDRCRRCSAPVGPHLDTRAGCVHCAGERWTFERVMSLGPYADGLRDACLRIKRPGTEPLAAAMTEELARLWREALWAAKYDLIVPVPHHWRQRIWRTQLVPVSMARTLSRAIGVPLSQHLVRKARFTKLQSSLTITERRENLRNAFRPVPGRRLGGGRILIVDDILTTGTTSDRVARVLKALGATAVDVAVIARAIRHP